MMLGGETMMLGAGDYHLYYQMIFPIPLEVMPHVTNLTCARVPTAYDLARISK